MKLRTWSIRRWVLVIAGIAMLLLIGLRLRLKWEIHRELTDLRRAGLPTNWRELSEFYGRIPESSNAAPLLTNAYTLLVMTDASVNSKIPVMGITPLPPIDRPWPEDIDREIRVFLDQNSAALTAVLSALQRPDYRYYRDFGAQGYDAAVLMQPKRTIQLLSLATMYAAQRGENQRAWQLADAEVKLAALLQHEPLVVNQLVRMAMVQVPLLDIERLLSLGGATASELAATRNELGRASRKEMLARSIAGDRAGYLESMYWQSEWIGLDNADWELREKPWFKSAWIHAKLVGYRMAGLGDQDILYYIEQSRSIEAVASKSLLEMQRLIDNGTNYLPSARGLSFHYWSEMGLQIYPKILSKMIFLDGRLGAADAALAAAQYQLQHEGKLPASLDELVPELLDAVPIESRTGKPFELIKTGDGFGIGCGVPVFKVRLNGARREPSVTE